MKRFLVSLGRFFVSARFLKIVLWTVTIIVLFYVEEDWRGARAWEATKAKWEARGETFDLSKFTPPPVPDGQNLGALPLFQVVERRSNSGAVHYLDPAHFREAFARVSWTGSDLPSIGAWIRGNRPDRTRIVSTISAKYAATFKRPPTIGPRAQLEALFPFLPGLRAAAAERPFCRFAYDDTQLLPAARGMELITGQIELSRLLAADGILALHEKETAAALSDLVTILKLRDGVDSDPSVLGGLVSAGMFSMANGVIWEGLADHAWSDAQLVEIERRLQAVDFLAAYRFDMSAEAALSAANLDYFKGRLSPDFVKMLTSMFVTTDIPAAADSRGSNLIWTLASFFWALPSRVVLAPRGWIDLNKTVSVEYILQAREVIDDRSRRVDAAGSRENQARFAHLNQSGVSPTSVLALVLTGSLGPALVQFSVEEVRVDETRLACALERYWLAHRAYPPSLDVLVPGQIAALPRDPMNGAPYHYRLRPDGTYLLYSVGWNQTDDGGVVVYTDSNHNGFPSQDYEQGDWVWPTPK